LGGFLTHTTGSEEGGGSTSKSQHELGKGWPKGVSTWTRGWRRRKGQKVAIPRWGATKKKKIERKHKESWGGKKDDQKK